MIWLVVIQWLLVAVNVFLLHGASGTDVTVIGFCLLLTIAFAVITTLHWLDAGR